MLFLEVSLLFTLALKTTLAYQLPFISQNTFESSPSPRKPLISRETEAYIDVLLTKWNSPGLSVAVIQKDETTPTGWRQEFGSYGVARNDGSPVTPDTLFAIASNSKLFLALSVGLLISNDTLAKERGKHIDWTTKIHTLIPEWGLQDEIMHKGVNLQDMLSHRTGMPRHDFSGAPREGGIREMISTLRYLRPSAEFRETFQYNNLMYETLSYLPQVLLNQSYEAYIEEHLFSPLNMSSSTYNIAKAEQNGTLAHGFQRSMQDLTKGLNGTLTATIPFFQRPGEERIWAGAGGVLSSTRDLANWQAMLLNDGRHPFTNKTIVPKAVLDHVTEGLSVSEGKASDPELSPKVYGCGQWRYSYQGHEIIEHGGSDPGFKTQVARFPNDNLGIVVLSNDAKGNFLIESVKWRIAEELLGLNIVEWNDRYEKVYNKYVNESRVITPRPPLPKPPSSSFKLLSENTYRHPTYGVLEPCLVPAKGVDFDDGDRCTPLLRSHPVQRILSVSDLSIPTYIMPFQRSFATHLRLSHFSANLFNVTVVWTNDEVRQREGHTEGTDTLIGLDEHFEVEWVDSEEEGLAFKGGFWGKEGPYAKAPEGTGKESAEVWFARVYPGVPS